MTTHNSKCKMAFGRPTKTLGDCQRCDELRNGAKPRESWGADKKRREEAFRASLKRHDCKQAGCSYICTFGDW